MRDAILGVQDTKKIHFNLCNWGRDEVWRWGAQYGHSWRYDPPLLEKDAKAPTLTFGSG